MSTTGGAERMDDSLDRCVDEMVDWLEEQEADLHEQLKAVRADKEVMLRTRMLHQQWRAASNGEKGLHSHISPRDLLHCGSQGEALVTIACHSDGLLHYQTAGRLLRMAGLSKAKSEANMSRDIRRRLLADAKWQRWDTGYSATCTIRMAEPTGIPRMPMGRRARLTYTRAPASAARTNQRIDEAASESAPPRRKTPMAEYTQNWQSYDAAKTHELEYVEIFLRDLCDQVQEPAYKWGRPLTWSGT